MSHIKIDNIQHIKFNLILNMSNKILNYIEHDNKIKYFISSVISSSTAELITYPICTIKTNFQVTESRSIADTVKNMYANGGFKSFYNGLKTAVFTQMVSTTVKYNVYQNLNINYNKQQRFHISVLFGLTGGIVSTFITHPMDFFKITFQMKGLASQEIQMYGYRVLYRGYSKTLYKAIAGSGFFFPIYDLIKRETKHPLLSAFGSAIISTTLMHPIDYLKTRIIYNNANHHQTFINNLIIYIKYKLFNNQNNSINVNEIRNNVKDCYKGLSLNLSRVVPHFVIMMSCMEYWNRKFCVTH